eukprot:4755810-Amphidinium_carterae.1
MGIVIPVVAMPRFRLQFAALERPLIGMHGSYVVACHSVEKAVGFRYGMKGSITEATLQDIQTQGLRSPPKRAKQSKSSGIHVEA